MMRTTLLLIASSFLAAGQSGPAPNYAPAKADAFLATNDPDRFAWQLFCAISAPANNGDARDIIWETWPEQSEIYANPFVAPTWPGAAHRAKTLRESTQHIARALETAANSDPIPPFRDSLSNEEVRDNREAFDYILGNQLWYKEGIAAKTTNDELLFPFGAIAIKGKWKIITEAQKERFHWQGYTGPDGKPAIVGLVALHISSNIIPNWHWSTFEQIDNPGLADYIGVHDRFGMRPTDIAPNRRTNQGYADAGTLTGEVTAMMRERNLSPALSKYYRLKGSQIDFVDRSGRPTVVGNSITEAGFVSTSSCITCHSRSNIGAPLQGQNNLPAVPKPLTVFTPRGESYNGPPDPKWFWDETPSRSTPPVEPESFHKQLDFLWQLAFGPKSRVGPVKK